MHNINLSRKHNVATVNFNVSVLCKMCYCKKAARKSAKTVGKDSGCESRAYIVSIDRKTTVYRLEAREISFFFEEHVPVVHNNVFPYLTDLPVSSSLYHLYSSRTGLHNSV